MDRQQITDWLMQGDPAIAYQAARDLLGEDRPDLRARIPHHGWGKAFLDARNPNGGWGERYYGARWTNTHYTLLDLAAMSFPPDHPEMIALVRDIARTHVAADGGLADHRGAARSDTCITGMFLNFACHFRVPQRAVLTFVDFLLSVQLPDGGFNCRINRSGCHHSSLHSTLSVLEGFQRYEANRYAYRLADVQKAAGQARAFILAHRFFRSDRTGHIIKADFLRFPYPPRWSYNILRALDHFRDAKQPYHPAMDEALERVAARRRGDGRWPVMARRPGKTFFDMETGPGPSRWNTLIAMRVLDAWPRPDRPM